MSKTIYLIDADDISLFVTQQIILRYNSQWRVVRFTSAEQALETLLAQAPFAAQLPDLILLEQRLPGMSGWGFLKAIHKLSPLFSKALHCKILTSSLDAMDAVRAESLGAKGCLSKPLKIRDLVAYEADPFDQAEQQAAPVFQDGVRQGA